MIDGYTKFRLQVSEDRMSISLFCMLPEKVINYGPLLARLEGELSSKGVADPPSSEQLKLLLVQAAAKGTLVRGLVLAEGSPPEPARDASIEWGGDFPWAEKPAGDRREVEGYRSRAGRLAVQEDRLLAKYIPHKEGRDGRDVFGKRIPAAKPKEVTMKAGPNVRAEAREEAVEFYATATGQLRWADGVLAVDEVMVIAGGLGEESEPVSAPGALVVEGDVLLRARIEAEGDVEIQGILEAANVKAGGSLYVDGGITGAEGAEVRVKGTVAAKFIQNADIEAGGDILVEGDIHHSVVKTRGALRAPRGRLVGRAVTALSGIEVAQAGSVGVARTELSSAEDYFLSGAQADKKKRIWSLEEKLENIKNTLRLLMVRQRTLSPEQREKTTVLFVEQSETEAEIEKLKEEVAEIQSVSLAHAEPVILIHEKVFPDTFLSIQGIELPIKKSYQGPIRAVVKAERVVLERPGEDGV